MFQTADARADHEDYVSAGFSGGAMLEFSRPFRTPDGAESEASFRLASLPICVRRIFYALYVSAHEHARAGARCAPLMAHENGVIGLAAVTLCEPHPQDYADLLGVASRVAFRSVSAAV